MSDEPNYLIYLIDGKPHRLCDCDERAELCPRGAKRTLQTCGFSRCFVPAPDVVYTGNELSERIAELEAALASRNEQIGVFEQRIIDLEAALAAERAAKEAAEREAIGLRHSCESNYKLYTELLPTIEKLKQGKGDDDRRKR